MLHPVMGAPEKPRTRGGARERTEPTRRHRGGRGGGFVPPERPRSRSGLAPPTQPGCNQAAKTLQRPPHTADPLSSLTALPSRPPPPGNKPKMLSLKGLRGQVKARQSPPAPPAWLCPPAHPFPSPVWGWAALGHPIKPCQTVPHILTPPNIPPLAGARPPRPQQLQPILALKTELFLSVLKRDVSQQPDFSPWLQHQLLDPVPVLSPPGAGEGRGGRRHSQDPPELGKEAPVTRGPMAPVPPSSPASSFGAPRSSWDRMGWGLGQPSWG